MKEVVSADISKIQVHVLYDLTTVNPFVKITNQSEGANLPGTKWAFEAFSSSGVPYHLGALDTPDAVGAWDSFIIPEAILQVLGHIEWSGAAFRLVARVQDSAGQIFSEEYLTEICRPSGNTNGQKDNYGTGKLDLKVQCEIARVRVQDNTPYGYKGLPGVLDGKTLQLVYPKDNTGTQPAPFEVQQFNLVRIPVWYSAKNYQVLLQTIMLYHFQNNTSVRIKYKFKTYFDVQCNVDLCKLLCDVNKLMAQVQADGCTAEVRDRLLLMSLKLSAAIIAKMQPTCGLDLVKLVEEIKELGGLTCDCTTGDGIPQISSIPYEGFAPNTDGTIPNDLNSTII